MSVCVGVCVCVSVCSGYICENVNGNMYNICICVSLNVCVQTISILVLHAVEVKSQITSVHLERAHNLLTHRFTLASARVRDTHKV